MKGHAAVDHSSRMTSDLLARGASPGRDSRIGPGYTPPGQAGKRVFAAIPARNEAPAIGGVVAGLTGHADVVVVVDDGSADETADAARRAGAEVLRHAINRGQG